MPRPLAAFVVVAALLLPAAARAEHREEAVLAELLAALAAAREELRALDGLVDAAGSRDVQRELHRKAWRIEELLGRGEQLSHDLARVGGATTVVVVEEHPATPPPPVFVGPMACSGHELEAIARAVEAESFSAGKLDVLRGAARERWFDVDQVLRLMQLMTFGKDMVEAGVILHPRTVNTADWYRVYSAFTFDSDKRALRERVGM